MVPRVGVVTLQTLLDLDPLKRILLYFDEINIACPTDSVTRIARPVDLTHLERRHGAVEGVFGAPEVNALFDYLNEQTWCKLTTFDDAEVEDVSSEIRIAFCRQYDIGEEQFEWLNVPVHEVGAVRDAIYERRAASRLTKEGTIAVPTFPTPTQLSQWEWGWEESCYSIVLKKFPVPSELVPIEDILAFKVDEESVRRRNALISWQNKVSREHYTAREIQEELEQLLAEYTSYMRLLDKRFALGVVETVVRIPLAIAENLAKLRLSEVVEPIFDLMRLSLELTEAERNAPGVEVAYIADASERLGQ